MPEKRKHPINAVQSFLRRIRILERAKKALIREQKNLTDAEPL